MNHQIEFKTLCEAIKHRDVDKVKKLLDTTGIDVTQLGSLLYHAVIYAVQEPSKYDNDDIELVELLLKRGANPNTKQDGIPVLHYAAARELYWKPHWILLDTLLEHGADPNLKCDQDDYSVLHEMSIRSDRKEIEWDLKNRYQFSGMRKCFNFSIGDKIEWIGCVKSLMLWGANPNIQSDETWILLESFQRFTCASLNLYTVISL